MMRLIFCVLTVFVSGVFVPGVATAQPATDTLRVSWRDPPAALDPYDNGQRTTRALTHEIWDTLLDRDPNTFQFKPLLATSWSRPDSTTIDFTLRPDVHFHDGSALTADDVVYTVATVLADPHLAVPGNFAFLAGAEVLDPLKVRLHLKYPFPAALDYLAMALPILPHATRETMGAAAYAHAPIGTGPYRVAHFDADSIVLDRADDYFPDSPKGKPAIAHVILHGVADSAAEVADLATGRADWIWRFGLDALDLLNRDSNLTTMRMDAMRLSFIALQANRPAEHGGDDPLAKLAVRQAIFHALDRKAMGEGARLLDAPCFPTQFGCDQAAATPYRYDPDLARQMLADAGYPNGFPTVIYATIQPRDLAVIEKDLGAVGIEAHVVAATQSALPAMLAAHRVPALAGSWSNYAINDMSTLLLQHFTGGPFDLAGDKDVAALVRTGSETTDPDERRRAYSDAITRITAQAYWLPLHTDTTSYAMVHALAFRPEPDDLPRFYTMSWR